MMECLPFPIEAGHLIKMFAMFYGLHIVINGGISTDFIDYICDSGYYAEIKIHTHWKKRYGSCVITKMLIFEKNKYQCYSLFIHTYVCDDDCFLLFYSH